MNADAKHKLIRNYAVSDAAVHDSQELDGLLDKGNTCNDVRHVLAAERLHGDDTTVPLLAKGKTVTGCIWTYARDDRPFGGHAPAAVLYCASRDRKHEHPVQHLQAFTGILQADAYSGYNELYVSSRSEGAITAALCGHTQGDSSSSRPISLPMLRTCPIFEGRQHRLCCRDGPSKPAPSAGFRHERSKPRDFAGDALIMKGARRHLRL